MASFASQGSPSAQLAEFKIHQLYEPPPASASASASASAPAPAPASAAVLDKTHINYYLNYLAIIDNIHDFFHGRGTDCPEVFKRKIVEAKKELETILEQNEINRELFLEENVAATTITPEFESLYTKKILGLLGLEAGIIQGNIGRGVNPYEAFITGLGLSGKTFYTTHDSAFKMRNFRFDSKIEARFGCTHCILKTPQNNFDSATSSASPSVIKKKTVIVYPVNVNSKHEWIFKSNILTRNMNGKMSFEYAPESTTGLLGSLALWQLFYGRKATFKYEGTTTIETTFKPIGALGGVESGAGVKLFCNSMSQLEQPAYDKPKTVAQKIYNIIVGNNKKEPADITKLPDDEMHYLILDLKRSGDWEQVLAAKWFKEHSNYPDCENTIVITGDYLCFLYAAINNVDCVFLGASKYLFYSDEMRRDLGSSPPGMNPSIHQSGGGKYKKPPPLSSTYPPRKPLGTLFSRSARTKRTYFYTEEDYMDDFYTLLKNIRHNTMSWHYETVGDKANRLEEDYYDNIITLIKNFNFENSFENFKTSLSEDFNIEESNIKKKVNRESNIYKNIDSILQMLRFVFRIYTSENAATPALPKNTAKNTAANTFLQTQIYPPLNESYEYDAYRIVYELAYKKIFLMSICILFEYLSLYYEKDLKIDPMRFSNPNIKPGFPHIIESFYYFIITNMIYKRNYKFNLKEEKSVSTISRFLAITYSLLGASLLGKIDLNKKQLWESFNLQGFEQGNEKEIFLANYYPDLTDITSQDYYIESARTFLGLPPLSSSSQSQGGARKNKMIRQIKKKKTKRKHKKRKTKRKRRRQKEKDKKKNKKRKKTRRKKVIKRKKHTRRKHLNKSK